MRDQLRPIPDFPDYEITKDGRVWNPYRERWLRGTINMYGTPTVMLRDSSENKQYGRSIPTLVIQAWSTEKFPLRFNTVVHLDGNRKNCHIDNLTVRPRRHAVEYHQQLFTAPKRVFNGKPIQIIETGEIFKTPRSCSMVYGVLDADIISSVLTGKTVFPHNFTIRILE